MSSPSSRSRALNPVRWSFGVQILLGLAVGIVAGLLARATGSAWLTGTLTQVGSFFVQLLKLAVPPLVFTAVLVSVAGLRHVTNAARLAGRTLLWFMGTALVAVAVGIVLGLLSNPGQGVDLSLAGAKEPQSKGGWTDFLTGIIPTNVIGAFTNGNVLQLVFLGAVLGVAALKLGEAAKPFLTLAESVLELVQKALWWVIRLAPIGTAGLIGKAIASYGWNLLRPLATFTIAVYAGCLIVLVVVYPVLLRVVGGVNPLRFYAKAWPAVELAFVSRSSIGTMPLTQRMVTERLGVPNEYASFAVPFGATTKMDGCAAVYPALAAIFVAQVTGTHLDLRDYLLIAFVSVVGSAATAGLTGAIVMLTLTLSTLGLPLAGAGLLLAIDPILDMIRTATNVAGQMVVPVLVAKREGILDKAAFDQPAAPLTAATPRTPEPVPAAA
ncbi:cation:dicarboxylase symporter family transporter [Nocardia brasiliensis]|uniref:Cation:dicarboxylase symporter family transporter n=1 Tax=Nocardia brasiliensis TaxID=37326 RepID=A0A6G9XUT7_NOCBR|nr:dicarboxylate/amino acid:cation symporter [Nocardia brasiliensis]QIS04668.1 cation:dicarboxylase symporter family transporter [Nocardia brasiliensis]